MAHSNAARYARALLFLTLSYHQLSSLRSNTVLKVPSLQYHLVVAWGFQIKQGSDSSHLDSISC